MTLETKQRDRRIAFWLGFASIIATLITSFILVLIGKGAQLSEASGVIGASNAAIASLGIANYLSKPVDQSASKPLNAEETYYAKPPK